MSGKGCLRVSLSGYGGGRPRVIDFVGEPGRAHPHLVPRLEEARLDALAVDVAAVAALEVHDHVAFRRPVDARVEGGDLRVGDHDVVVAMASDGVGVAGVWEGGLGLAGDEHETGRYDLLAVGHVRSGLGGGD